MEIGAFRSTGNVRVNSQGLSLRQIFFAEFSELTGEESKHTSF